MYHLGLVLSPSVLPVQTSLYWRMVPKDGDPATPEFQVADMVHFQSPQPLHTKTHTHKYSFKLIIYTFSLNSLPV
jgi:hypothetical protein